MTAERFTTQKKQTCACSVVSDSANPMDCIAHQTPLSMGFHRQESFTSKISQAEWVAISSFRGSSQLRDQTCVTHVSCIGRWILYH